MWWLMKPMDGFVAMVTILIAVLSLVGGVGYLLAAFLLSRRSLFWRLSGGIIDATVTAIVAWVIFWLAEQSAADVNSCCQGDPKAVPAVVLAAIAVVWIGVSLPMLAWFLLGTADRFQQRRQQA
jgi:hypothetical protein